MHVLRKAKVTQLARKTIIKQNVPSREIAVDVVVFLEVLHRRAALLNKPHERADSNARWRVSSSTSQELVEAAVIAKLGHDEHGLTNRDYAVEINHVGVMHAHHELGLVQKIAPSTSSKNITTKKGTWVVENNLCNRCKQQSSTDPYHSSRFDRCTARTDRWEAILPLWWVESDAHQKRRQNTNYQKKEQMKGNDGGVRTWPAWRHHTWAPLLQSWPWVLLSLRNQEVVQPTPERINKHT
jgi:hypothetical protein